MRSTAEFRQAASAERLIRSPALAVDLDGTLVKTDVLLESLLVLLKEKPYYVFHLPGWLLKGMAFFKQQVAQRVSLDVSALPYREDFLAYLKTQRTHRRTIVLATANDIRT